MHVAIAARAVKKPKEGREKLGLFCLRPCQQTAAACLEQRQRNPLAPIHGSTTVVIEDAQPSAELWTSEAGQAAPKLAHAELSITVGVEVKKKRAPGDRVLFSAGLFSHDDIGIRYPSLRLEGGRRRQAGAEDEDKLLQRMQ